MTIDNNNPALYYSLGSVHGFLKQREEERARSGVEGVESLRRLEQAEAAYEQALLLNPDYFDARYNLGALYYNQGVFQNNASIDLTDPVLY